MKAKLFKSLIAGITLSVSLSSHAALVGYINAGGSDISFLNTMGHTVSVLNNPIGLTMGDLSSFDAVIASSNFVFSEATNIGNMLKGFADNGGGVVLNEFVFQGNWALSGGINDSGYNPFINDPASSGYINSVTVGSVFDATNSLFSGVNTGNIFGQYNANVGLDATATLVADWSNGRHAFAYNSLANSAVVGLNMFQFNNADEQMLLNNALDIAINGASNQIPEPSTIAILALGLIGLRTRKIFS